MIRNYEIFLSRKDTF